MRREAAIVAGGFGNDVVMGSPNVVRGGSHLDGINASSLVAEGFSSDYVPASMLHAAFLLRDTAGWGISDAVACVSSRPARTVGLTDRGELAPGMRADFIRVRENSGAPIVIGAWRQGDRIA